MVAGTQYNNRIIHSDIQPELCGSRLTRHMEQPPRADHLHYRRIRTVTEGPESQQQSNHGAGTETTRANVGDRGAAHYRDAAHRAQPAQK